MKRRAQRFSLLPVLAIFLILLPGCDLLDWLFKPPSADHCYTVERLTNNDYNEVGPKILMAEDGPIAVFWLSLEMMTPFVVERHLSAGSWSVEARLASCVGDWDVTATRDGFLLVRSDWGNVFVDDLQSEKRWELTTEGGAGSPVIISTGTRAYALWQRRLAEGSFVVERAIYRGGDWSASTEVLAVDHRAERLLLLGKENGLLLVIETDSGIYTARLSEELRLEGALLEMHSSSAGLSHIAGAVTPDGIYWLAWAEGLSGEEQVYGSSSSNGDSWSEPRQVSLEGKQNIRPAIAADQHYLYLVWSSSNGGGGEYGQLKGRRLQIGGADWRKIKELYEGTPLIYGRDIAVTSSQEQVWLVWEWDEEIYALRLCG